MFWLLAETSTPLVNVHWWFGKAGVKGLPVQLNGLLMLGAFGCSRVFHLPWTYSWIMGDFAAMTAKVNDNYGYYVVACALFNAGLQCYWFSLMVRGAIKGATGVDIFFWRKKKPKKGLKALQ